MFTLKPSEDEIQKVWNVLSGYVYPKHINSMGLAFLALRETGEIPERKARLCIVELRKRGNLIIAKKGYSLAGNEAEPVNHFINGLYSRASKLRQEADGLYALARQKYGDKALEIEQNPGQPGLNITPIPEYTEPAQTKSYDSLGNVV